MGYNKFQSADFMLDLETLGKNHNPVLTQLACVAFDPWTGKVHSTFNRLIDPQSCARVGLSCGGEDATGTTLDFWLSQPKEVFNKVIVKSMLEGDDVVQVLKDFTAWVEQVKKDLKVKSGKFYGNGPAADCVWMRSSYKACGLEAPWKYWDDVDVRTYTDILRRDFDFDPKTEIPFEGNKHDAIDDCIHQIKTVVKAKALMKGKS